MSHCARRGSCRLMAAWRSGMASSAIAGPRKAAKFSARATYSPPSPSVRGGDPAIRLSATASAATSTFRRSITASRFSRPSPAHRFATLVPPPGTHRLEQRAERNVDPARRRVRHPAACVQINSAPQFYIQSRTESRRAVDGTTFEHDVSDPSGMVSRRVAGLPLTAASSSQSAPPNLVLGYTLPRLTLPDGGIVPDERDEPTPVSARHGRGCASCLS